MTGKQEGNPFVILFSLWLLVFAASSQIMIISPILPRISEQLQTSESLLGMLVTAYAAMVGLFAIISGPFSDRIGRRKILLFGTFGMALALLLHYFVFNFTSFLVVRALAGMAGGILSGSSVSYVGDYFPYERRGWANGWIMSGIAMGQILGIPLGTVIADWMGFRAPFVLFGFVMVAAFFMIFFGVPQPNVTMDKNRVTLKGSLIKYKQLLLRADIRATSLCYALMFMSLSVYIVFLPTWLESEFQVTGKEIALLFFFGGIANVIASPQAGRISDRIGRKSMIIISCVGLSLVMILTTFVIIQFWISYVLFFLAMILVAMRISPFQALSSELVPAANRGSLMSLLIAIGQIGYGIGGGISGIFYVEYGYISNTILGAATIMIMAFIVWKFIPEPELRTQTI